MGFGCNHHFATCLSHGWLRIYTNCIMPKFTHRLYISIALPRILYAIDVWCTPIHGAQAGPKRKGSVSVIKKLITAQRAGTIAIMGALRTSPTETLDACAFTIPADLLVEKWCHKAAICLAMLPPKHPLHKPVKVSARKNTKRHKAPLNNLMQIFELDPKAIEKISVAVHNPLDLGTDKAPLHINIASSKEKSKEEALSAKEMVKVYTDGS